MTDERTRAILMAGSAVEEALLELDREYRRVAEWNNKMFEDYKLKARERWSAWVAENVPEEHRSAPGYSLEACDDRAAFDWWGSGEPIGIPYDAMAYAEAALDWTVRGKHPEAMFTSGFESGFAPNGSPYPPDPWLMLYREELEHIFGLRILTHAEARAFKAKTTTEFVHKHVSGYGGGEVDPKE